MLPLGVLFVLFAVGVWAYCLIDAIMTPPEQLRSLTTMSWALLITVLPVIGAIAWLLAGRPDRSWRTPTMPQHLAGMPRLGPQQAIRRHPAGRAVEPDADRQPESWDCPVVSSTPPIGPDDDPEFLRELERRFRNGPGRDSEL
jgi:Phospholipase_D-nuclease N-terminal